MDAFFVGSAIVTIRANGCGRSASPVLVSCLVRSCSLRRQCSPRSPFPRSPWYVRTGAHFLSSWTWYASYRIPGFRCSGGTRRSRRRADAASCCAAGALAAAAGVRVRPDAGGRGLAGDEPDGGAGGGRLGVISFADERARAAASAERRMGACVCECVESALRGAETTSRWGIRAGRLTSGGRVGDTQGVSEGCREGLVRGRVGCSAYSLIRAGMG